MRSARRPASSLDPPSRRVRDAEQHHERDRQQHDATRRRRRWSLSLSIWPNTNTDATSVLNGRLPLISTIEPNSPTARPNASPTPARIAGRSAGRMIRRKIVDGLGAERRGGLLDLAVERHQHGLHRAHDERQRHEQQRQRDADPRVGDVDPDRAVRCRRARAA